ncbi:MAG: hypothetical protein JW810_10645, partial [Sedimentisphaerales bacterium]|nr:hypothetical protein [Sedimentisphaerales bacterium]
IDAGSMGKLTAHSEPARLAKADYGENNATGTCYVSDATQASADRAHRIDRRDLAINVFR